jgi:hypothetical protein
MYKKEEENLDISFSQLILEFSLSDNQTLKLITAKSLHEAFKLVEPDHDTTDLRRCFLNFLVDGDK